MKEVGGYIEKQVAYLSGKVLFWSEWLPACEVTSRWNAHTVCLSSSGGRGEDSSIIITLPESSAFRDIPEEALAKVFTYLTLIPRCVFSSLCLSISLSLSLTKPQTSHEVKNNNNNNCANDIDMFTSFSTSNLISFMTPHVTPNYCGRFFVQCQLFSIHTQFRQILHSQVIIISLIQIKNAFGHELGVMCSANRTPLLNHDWAKASHHIRSISLHVSTHKSHKKNIY